MVLQLYTSIHICGGVRSDPSVTYVLASVVTRGRGRCRTTDIGFAPPPRAAHLPSSSPPPDETEASTERSQARVPRIITYLGPTSPARLIVVPILYSNCD